MTRMTFLDGLDPGDTVLAVFTNGKDDQQPLRFLGTGFFASTQRTFVTAFHNLPDTHAEVSVVSTRDTDKSYAARLVAYDADVDLAILDVYGGFVTPKPFSIYPYNNTLMGLPVKCIEFGTTVTVAGVTELSMAARQGNITRQFRNLDRFGKAGIDALELSFPVLRGASGAPVLIGETWQVVGVMKANISYHLIPAQIEEYVADDGNEQERVSFMMPEAIAIHVGHLRSLLDDAIRTIYGTTAASEP